MIQRCGQDSDVREDYMPSCISVSPLMQASQRQAIRFNTPLTPVLLPATGLWLHLEAPTVVTGHLEQPSQDLSCVISLEPKVLWNCLRRVCGI